MTDLRLEHVSRAYGAKLAIADLDLHIQNGEFVSLLGPSGCGKSTTLNLIAGLDRLTGGRISIGGVVVASAEDGVMVPPEQRELGLVPQSYALWPHLTVSGNVGFPLKLRRVARAERERRIREALELVEIGEYAERYPHELSGGQQQRVAVARTLVYRPKVLLLDEPLSNLDAKLRDRAREWLRSLQRELGVTTVFVTHDQTEALSLSDRVAVMDSGRLVQFGSPEEIYSRPTTPFVADFVGGCSFLVGTVVAAGADGAVLDLDGGVRLRVPRLASGGSVGDRLRLVLRPEWLRVLSEGEAGAAEGVLLVQVLSSEFAGGHYLHRAKAGNAVIRFAAPVPHKGELTLACDTTKLVSFRLAPGEEASASSFSRD